MQLVALKAQFEKWKNNTLFPINPGIEYLTRDQQPLFRYIQHLHLPQKQ